MPRDRTCERRLPCSAPPRITLLLAASPASAQSGATASSRARSRAPTPRLRRRHRRPRRRRHLGPALDHGLRQAARRRSRTRRFRSCRGRRRCTSTTSRTQVAYDPQGFCLPPGGPRMFGTPYPSEFIQDRDRIVVIFEGGAHVWREIHMDGRPLPKREELNPTYFGYSVGRWDGDTLVVETTGFNEKTWLNFNGAMHTDELHTVERISRPNRDTLHYEATITDPGAYTRAVDDRVGHSVARGRGARRIHLPGEQSVLARPQGRLRQSVLRGRADAEPLRLPFAAQALCSFAAGRCPAAPCAARTPRASRSPAGTSTA